MKPNGSNTGKATGCLEDIRDLRIKANLAFNYKKYPECIEFNEEAFKKLSIYNGKNSETEEIKEIKKAIIICKDMLEKQNKRSF